MLFLFGAMIESAQEYLNTLVHHRINGNFDPIDLKYNFLGICLFSLFWVIYYASIKDKNIYINNGINS